MTCWRNLPNPLVAEANAEMSNQNIESIYRLTAMQEGMLFHSLEAPQSGVYFNQYHCILDGPLDIQRFTAAWDTVAARHPVLRSLFTWERRDQPLQIVRNQVKLPWAFLDWRGQESESSVKFWQGFLKADQRQGFQLTQAPVMRFALAQIAKDRVRFLWSFHHIVLDGWSVRLIMDEVLRLYGQAPQRPPQKPAVPFGVFVAWLDKLDPRPAMDFWTATLKGFESPTSLPVAMPQPRPAKTRDPRTSTITKRLSLELSERLAKTAKENRLTLNTMLVGAWAILLSRHSGLNDVVFGTTVSGRAIDLEGVEQIAGPLLNTLPLRVQIQPDQPSAQWLREVQSRQLGTREHEQSALSSIQNWSEVPAGQALFETILVFESFPCRDDPENAGIGITLDEEAFVETSNYPLALLAVPEDCLSLVLVVDGARYSDAEADRLLQHLENLLASMAADLTRPVAEHSMISDQERRMVLETWNETQQPFPDDIPIQNLIEQWVRERPDALAIASDDEDLSYAELDRRVKNLACRLTGLGIGRDKGVPVFAERSTAAVVAMLAVIYAGGAYVPIDPAYPEQRVRHVLDDVSEMFLKSAGRPVVLTQGHLRNRLPSGDFDVIVVDDGATAAPESDAPEILATAAAGDLAYIIHTSGSTGRPKGVMVSHRNLVNSTTARAHAYLEPLKSFLLLSSIATDSSIVGIFWTLSTGATLVLPRGRQEQDIQQLAALFSERQVTHTLCVPSLYDQILENSDIAQLSTLRAVIVAGESCGADLVLRHHQLLPQVALYNEYGPTEGTVWASVARLAPEQPVTIGRPIANVTLYVLDEHLQAVPAGLPGELYIGGAGVAQGYLNRPQQTAEAFLPDPFQPAPNARLYRTGDRVRHTVEGEIQYLGRVDNQIKVRGFRVEPEEIERCLVTHPGIDEVVVVLSGVGPKERGFADDPEAMAAAVIALNPAEADRLLADFEDLMDSTDYPVGGAIA